MKRLSPLQSSILKGAAALLSPAGRRASLLVLMYHRVLPEPDPLLPDEPDATRFTAQMLVVRDLFQVMDLADAVARLGAGQLPARAVAITFDDGYLNNVRIAAPILSELGLTATCFVATGFMDGSAMWNDTVIEALRRAPEQLDLREFGLSEYFLPDVAARRRAVDDLLGKLKYLEPRARLERTEAIAARVGGAATERLMMGESDVRHLATMGMSVGAHSTSHPILTRLPDDAARREIVDSKQRLEAVLRVPIRTFAYPNGRPGQDYDRRHVEMVRSAGFDAAVSTAWGAAAGNCDPLQIPRVAPWDESAFKYGLRMLRSFQQRMPRAV